MPDTSQARDSQRRHHRCPTPRSLWCCETICCRGRAQRHGLPHERDRDQRAGSHGRPYRDGDGNAYLPMPPARSRDVGRRSTGDRPRQGGEPRHPCGVYTHDMFSLDTMPPIAQLPFVPAADLDLIALRGPRNVVDRIVK